MEGENLDSKLEAPQEQEPPPQTADRTPLMAPLTADPSGGSLSVSQIMLNSKEHKAQQASEEGRNLEAALFTPQHMLVEMDPRMVPFNQQQQAMQNGQVQQNMSDQQNMYNENMYGFNYAQNPMMMAQNGAFFPMPMEQPPQSEMQCKYFLRGACWHGDNCRYLHTTPPANGEQEGNQGAENNNYQQQGFDPNVMYNPVLMQMMMGGMVPFGFPMAQNQWGPGFGPMDPNMMGGNMGPGGYHNQPPFQQDRRNKNRKGYRKNYRNKPDRTRRRKNRNNDNRTRRQSNQEKSSEENQEKDETNEVEQNPPEHDENENQWSTPNANLLSGENQNPPNGAQMLNENIGPEPTAFATPPRKDNEVKPQENRNQKLSFSQIVSQEPTNFSPASQESAEQPRTQQRTIQPLIRATHSPAQPAPVNTSPPNQAPRNIQPSRVVQPPHHVQNPPPRATQPQPQSRPAQASTANRPVWPSVPASSRKITLSEPLVKEEEVLSDEPVSKNSEEPAMFEESNALPENSLEVPLKEPETKTVPATSISSANVWSKPPHLQSNVWGTSSIQSPWQSQPQPHTFQSTSPNRQSLSPTNQKKPVAMKDSRSKDTRRREERRPQERRERGGVRGDPTKRKTRKNNEKRKQKRNKTADNFDWAVYDAIREAVPNMPQRVYDTIVCGFLSGV